MIEMPFCTASELEERLGYYKELQDARKREQDAREERLKGISTRLETTAKIEYVAVFDSSDSKRLEIWADTEEGNRLILYWRFYADGSKTVSAYIDYAQIVKEEPLEDADEWKYELSEVRSDHIAFFRPPNSIENWDALAGIDLKTKHDSVLSVTFERWTPKMEKLFLLPFRP